MIVQQIKYSLNWKRFRKGWSFFVPCTQLKEAEASIKEEAKIHKYTMVCRPVIENKLRGLRCWRTK